MVTNATIEALLGRRSIRKFKDEAIDDDTRATLETVAQHAASSQFLNDWSAIRLTDPAIKAKLAEFGHQPYIATAPLLYVFVIDEHRNARIAERKGIDPASDEFHLKYSYRFTQAQNDAVLALHAMETAAYSLGLGCVILGSLLNNIPGLIDVLNLPEYTYPVLGLAIGKPDQNPTVKPRMPRTMQFFENTYPADADGVLDQLPAFDEEVHRYYDLRQADRPVDAFSDQVATISQQDVSHQTLLDKAAAQGFRVSALRRLSPNTSTFHHRIPAKLHNHPAGVAPSINVHISVPLCGQPTASFAREPAKPAVSAPVVGIDCMWPQ